MISLPGHLIDAGQLDRLEELFTAADVTYDLTDFGQGTLEGLPAVREAALAMGERNPVAHHVTDVILGEPFGVGEADDARVTARSKGLGVMADGSCGSVTYEDTLTAARRAGASPTARVLAHRAPMGGRWGCRGSGAVSGVW